ncbi:MAG: YqaE/Pmp3 family membrane protein [Bacteroidia bacterium]|nr:YqaE/Pmp3 family membrane protein [Bacteroidia bacterium]
MLGAFIGSFSWSYANPATQQVLKAPSATTVVALPKKQTFIQKVKGFFVSAAEAVVNKPSKGLLIVLAIFIPWLAVGLATDWEFKHVLINILLGLFTCLGGIIHAIIIVNKYS